MKNGNENDPGLNMTQAGIQEKISQMAGQFAYAVVDEFTAIAPIPGMEILEPESPNSAMGRTRFNFPNIPVNPLARFLSIMSAAAVNDRPRMILPDGVLYGRLWADKIIGFSLASQVSIPVAGETIPEVAILPAGFATSMFSLLNKGDIQFLCPTASTMITLEFYMPTRDLGVREF